MSFSLLEIQISGFRSLRFLNLKLDKNLTVLIGKNNSGKSNILRAINAAMSPRFIAAEEDFYNDGSGVFDKTAEIHIDVKLGCCDRDGNALEVDSFWMQTYLAKYVSIQDNLTYVMYRVVFRYDTAFLRVVRETHAIETWDSVNGNKAKSKVETFSPDISVFSRCIYQSALRDFSSDLQNKDSFLSRALFSNEPTEEKRQEVASILDKANTALLDSYTTIGDVSSTLSEAAPIIGRGSRVSIEPLARSLADLRRGVGVTVSDPASRSFKVEQCGTGINSTLSLLAIKSYVSEEKQALLNQDPSSDSLFVLCIEEPEAYQHPQAQAQLLGMIEDFAGQVVLTTHSPTVLAQCPLDGIALVSIENGESRCLRLADIGLTPDDKNNIERWILKTKGELLFSNGVVLCEGYSDAEMISIFFRTYFKKPIEYYGINVVYCGGKHYRPFLVLLSMLGIPCFVFSDGEKDTADHLLKLCADLGFSTKNVVILENGDCLERYLVREGYETEIEAAIDEVEGRTGKYRQLLNNNHPKLTEFKKTGTICPTCKRENGQAVPINFNGLTQSQYELFIVLTRHNGKAKYCRTVAETISKLPDEAKNIPSKFRRLFEIIERELGI